MLIVIEGVDCTGKTSLANRIADKIGGRIIHAGPPRRHPLEEYETALDRYDPRDDDHLILDRWHIGEYVWPTIFNRPTQFTEVVQRHVQMFMRSRGAFTIFANRRNTQALKADLVSNNEPLLPHDLGQAQLMFTKALANAGSYGVWDYEYHTDTDIVNFIEAAKLYALDCSRVWEHTGPGWVGCAQPVVLFVGDELGPLRAGTEPPDDIPFAPYSSSSGAYLLECMPERTRIALVNSVQGRDQIPRDLGRVWAAFGRPNVVALGVKAGARLAEYGVPHRMIYHPQYWRRFHYKDKEGYAKVIKEAGWYTKQTI